MQPKKSSLVILVAVPILLVMSACLSGPATPPPPTATPCGPSAQSVYLMPALITKDYTNWSQFTPLQAMSLLTGQVERWSDFEDIVLDEKATYRITITLVTPELRRAAFIMEAIHRGRTQDEIRAGIDSISTSNLDAGELRFIVTITLKYTGGNLMDAQDKINIASGNLVMLDHHGTEISPASYEGALLTAFDVVDGPFAAYITFPLLNKATCESTVDLMQDTSATLKLRELAIGDKKFGNISWIITLSPLVNVGLPTLLPNPTVPAGGAAPYYLEPQTIPPTPNPGETNLMNLDNYWIELSKFIWAKMSASNSR